MVLTNILISRIKYGETKNGEKRISKLEPRSAFHRAKLELADLGSSVEGPFNDGIDCLLGQKIKKAASRKLQATSRLDNSYKII